MLELPIDSHLPGILKKFAENKNIILKASPGSGKTTRLPPALVKGGFGKVIVLVPKRIAAVSAADRIAEENHWTLGQEVGFHVRFEPVFTAQTKLLFMTEGVFIKKATDVDFWKGIDAIVFDEFHERSSLGDLALGLAFERQVLEDRPKIIVMSATLNSKALETYLPENKVCEIVAPPHPLKIKYSAKPQRLVCDHEFFNSVCQVTAEAWTESQKNILVFLPGFSEMKRVQNLLSKKLSTVSVELLHGSMKLSDQKNVLASQTYRRIILATDVAESSLTLPGVDAVVDCGLKKNALTEAKIGFKQLGLQRITLFSAQQRAGRAARTGPGTCYRLWHQSDERSMSEQIKPEILNSDLRSEILTLKSCAIENVETFSWLDQPNPKNLTEAVGRLTAARLLDSSQHLTTLGTAIQRLPLDIENGLLFYLLSEKGHQKEAAHLIACLETFDFASVFNEKSFTAESDLDRLSDRAALTLQGQKIRAQLLQIKINPASNAFSFRKTLIAIFFEFFPHRIAKRKSETDGLSSLGRGLTLLPGLEARLSDYYILLAGYNTSDSKTDIHFAVGLSKIEFLEFSAEKVREKTDYILDLEKKQIFKRQIKSIGQFVVTESAKTPLAPAEQPESWNRVLQENQNILLAAHTDYTTYVKKINFLKRKATELSLPPELFTFTESLTANLMQDLSESVTNLEGFFNYPLSYLLLAQTPPAIKDCLLQMPDHFDLPNGKKTSVIYDSENAPLISVKIQELFGCPHHPRLINNALPLTLELLAPNRRPTQITQNLELFWQKSYFEIRKELRPRYPRHPWPDNPAEYNHLEVKK